MLQVLAPILFTTAVSYEDEREGSGERESGTGLGLRRFLTEGDFFASGGLRCRVGIASVCGFPSCRFGSPFDVAMVVNVRS